MPLPSAPPGPPASPSPTDSPRRVRQAAPAVLPVAPAAGADSGAADLTRGFVLGFVGVVIFALTLPMTRIAVGDSSQPQLSPAFVTAARAALAGVASALYLAAIGALRRGSGAGAALRRHAGALALCAAGTVVGFPFGIAMALRDVPAAHAAVVTGLIPLATATVGALALRQRAAPAFWACAMLGFALVLAFALHQGGGSLVPADGWLALAVLSTGFGYVAGARVAAEMPAPQVICWVLVLALPFTLLATAFVWPAAGFAAVGLPAWGAFLYVSMFSMWLGFFAWYRGLALGGVLRVSQVQLLQPFLALLFAVPLLGEPLAPATLGFALAVGGVVLLARRLPATPRKETR